MRSILLVAFMACTLSLGACHPAEKNTKQYKYYCTMHPNIGSDNPGTCSKCGMDLIERDTTKAK